jgi:hypothetical protein
MCDGVTIVPIRSDSSSRILSAYSGLLLLQILRSAKLAEVPRPLDSTSMLIIYHKVSCPVLLFFSFFHICHFSTYVSLLAEGAVID